MTNDPLSKLFEGYLYLNWKTGHMTLKKKKSKSNNPFEIPIKVSIKVKIPIIKEHICTGEIIIPEQKVNEILVANI